MRVFFRKLFPVFIIIIIVMAAFLVSAIPALAPPARTIVTDQGDLPLYAVLTEKNQASVLDTYYVSVAGDMTYGVAPLDTYFQTWDPGDLHEHGIFPAYFTQLEFAFDPLQKTGTYNSVDNQGRPIAGEGGYWYAFNFEGASFAGPENLHFDLYNAKFARYASNDIPNDIVDTDLFVPPSDDTPRVPEPSTVLLLGAGLFGLAGFRRKFKV
ncbi:MAG TPA: PEP-CTERM sorting domain-containing protein [Proteobacteria bacterium]|nr:PEP-CTERM sorting domain-containing protein [Pseudomonadota bacterium]